MQRVPLNRLALFSVNDTNRITEMASVVYELGYDLLASTGTAKLIREAGLPVQTIEVFTGSPEMLDGAVKTLQMKVYAGLLTEGTEAHDAQLAKLQWPTIDWVFCNFYDVVTAINKYGISEPKQVLKAMDIGGPCMVRAAAKRAYYRNITVVPAVQHYDAVNAIIKAHGGKIPRSFRLDMAGKALGITVSNELALRNWFETLAKNEKDED